MRRNYVKQNFEPNVDDRNPCCSDADIAGPLEFRRLSQRRDLSVDTAVEVSGLKNKGVWLW